MGAGSAGTRRADAAGHELHGPGIGNRKRDGRPAPRAGGVDEDPARHPRHLRVAGGIRGERSGTQGVLPAADSGGQRAGVEDGRVQLVRENLDEVAGRRGTVRRANHGRERYRSWKINQSLFEGCGGRVYGVATCPPLALEAGWAYLEEREEAGDFAIPDAEGANGILETASGNKAPAGGGNRWRRGARPDPRRIQEAAETGIRAPGEGSARAAPLSCSIRTRIRAPQVPRRTSGPCLRRRKIRRG